MSKCLICENLYPPDYKECPICKNNLVREQFAPQSEEVETVEPVSALVVQSEFEVDE